MNINEIAQRAHENAKAKGFYEVPPTIPMRLLLIHSEISEACEAHRKDIDCARIAAKESILMDDERFKEYFESWIKSSFWDEIADVVIRCADFSASEQIALDISRGESFETADIAAALNGMHDSVSWASSEFNSGLRFAAMGFIDDVVLRCIQLAEANGVDLESHIVAKMRYNAMRPYKHGGKAY